MINVPIVREFEMKLYCSKCKCHNEHHVNPWRTTDEIVGAITTLCTVCFRMMILSLDKGTELKVDGKGNISLE